MAVPFSRAMHAIHTDNLRPVLVIIGLLLGVLAAWGAWLVFAQVPTYATSQTARLTSQGGVEATFPAEVLPRLQDGQRGEFRLAGAANGGAPGAYAVIIVAIDSTENRVWLAFPEMLPLPAELLADPQGEVALVVARHSPLSLILQAAGLTTAPG